MILVYSKAVCPKCTAAKNKLKAAGIEYTEVFVDLDPAARQTMIDAGHRSVPILYNNGVATSLENLLNKKE